MNDMKSNPPIDYASALKRLDGDRDFLNELLDIFQEDFVEKQILLHSAVERKDFIEISKLGHSLKGGAANLSLTRLQEAASQLEIAGKESDLSSARDHANRLIDEFKRLQQFLEQ